MSSLELLYPAKSATRIFFGNHDDTRRCVRSCCGIQREERRCITARNRVFSSYIGVKEAGLSKWEVQIGDWIMEQLAPLKACLRLARLLRLVRSLCLCARARVSSDRRAARQTDAMHVTMFDKKKNMKMTHHFILHVAMLYVLAS